MAFVVPWSHLSGTGAFSIRTSTRFSTEPYRLRFCRPPSRGRTAPWRFIHGQAEDREPDCRVSRSRRGARPSGDTPGGADCEPALPAVREATRCGLPMPVLSMNGGRAGRLGLRAESELAHPGLCRQPGSVCGRERADDPSGRDACRQGRHLSTCRRCIAAQAAFLWRRLRSGSAVPVLNTAGIVRARRRP